jgi:hypothetical protein
MLSTSYRVSTHYVRKVPAKGIYLPKASTLGYDRYLARQGDVIVFSYPGDALRWIGPRRRATLDRTRGRHRHA